MTEPAMTEPAMTKPKPNVLVEVTIAAPIDTVWAAVREPEQIAQWFGWQAETLAEEITMIFGSPVVDEQNHTLKFGEWEGIADGFELVERDGKTLLRVVRFGAIPDSWDDVYDDVREGWVTFARQLRFWIEHHRGQPRRTVYLAAPTPAGGSTLSAALGLATSWDAEPGTETSIDLPMHSVHASPSYRTGFQLELRVPAWGEGLLIVTDMPADAKRPARGSLLITTFGMDDAAAAAFETQWTQWWEDRHPPTSA